MTNEEAYRESFDTPEEAEAAVRSLKGTRTRRDSGGPAFPKGNDSSPQDGMSLRDYFAAAALQGWMASFGSDQTEDDVKEPEQVAKLAYRLADAMLAARKEKS